MLYLMSLSILQKGITLLKQFVHDESGDEILEKAAVIGAMTIAVVIIIALAVAAAAALNKGASWFGG